MKTDIDASQDAAVADLVRAGQVRIGMFPPHYIKNATHGRAKGVGRRPCSCASSTHRGRSKAGRISRS